jgi:hypothetical protein
MIRSVFMTLAIILTVVASAQPSTITTGFVPYPKGAKPWFATNFARFSDLARFNIEYDGRELTTPDEQNEKILYVLTWLPDEPAPIVGTVVDTYRLINAAGKALLSVPVPRNGTLLFQKVQEKGFLSSPMRIDLKVLNKGQTYVLKVQRSNFGGQAISSQYK